MGEVYEARDTRLGRTVALKVLPAVLAEHAERRARFEREARAVSQLSHAHVCALYDVGEEEGVHFLVLEHLEGQTLAERLQHAALSLEDSLRFGAQIAEALEAAHRQGVIHRDLKPANVMLTASGVKLLDFGLARVAAGEPVEVSNLPTMTMQEQGVLTEEGTVLGTFPYMAPEQVEGREADARSDIFALGAVLYEMATGRRAFDGESAASIMASVLREEPEPLSGLHPVAPPALDHVVSRCLAKDPEERWQNAKDVAVELRWVAEAGSQAGVAAPVAKRRRSRERLAWTLFAGALILAVAFGALWSTSREEPRVTRIPILVPPEAQDRNIGGPAVSPDGRVVAYSLYREGEWQLYLHPLDSLEPEPVLGGEGAQHVFFSPDGRWIAYFADGELRKIPATGGSPTVLCAIDQLLGGTWLEDGTIVFSGGPPGGLWRISESGGKPAALTRPESGEDGTRQSASHFTPRALPGGRALLFSSWNPSERREFLVGVVEIESGRIRYLVEGVGAVYSKSGHLLYEDASRRILYAAPFDPERLQIRGDPVVLAREVSDFALSEGGTLVYETFRETPQRLVWISPDGSRKEVPVPEKEYEMIRLSPDGTAAALAIEEGTAWDLWTLDLDRGTFTRLTAPGFSEWNTSPVWAPDGESIWFASDRSGPPNVYRVPARGGEEERVTEELAVHFPTGVTDDGTGLLLSRRVETGEGGVERRDFDLALLDLETGDLRTLVASKADEREGSLSPDNRWLAYGSEETGTRELYLDRFPEGGARRRVTIDGTNGGARWSPEGNRLLYQRGDELMVVEVQTEPELVLGRPEPLATVPELMDFDVAPDGRLLAIERTGPRERGLVVVQNWVAELESR